VISYQRRGDPFVGVDHQDPVTGGPGNAVVFLLGERLKPAFIDLLGVSLAIFSVASSERESITTQSRQQIEQVEAGLEHGGLVVAAMTTDTGLAASPVHSNGNGR